MRGEGRRGGSNWRKRRRPRILSAEEMDKIQKEKFIIRLFVIAKVKAHISALFPGSGSSLYVYTWKPPPESKAGIDDNQKPERNLGRRMRVP